MRIEVNNEDIGTQGHWVGNSLSNCMVARACKRAGFVDVSVGFLSATLDGVNYTIPAEVAGKIGQWMNWIHAFGDAVRPEPFSFEMTPDKE